MSETINFAKENNELTEEEIRFISSLEKKGLSSDLFKVNIYGIDKQIRRFIYADTEKKIYFSVPNMSDYTSYEKGLSDIIKLKQDLHKNKDWMGLLTYTDSYFYTNLLIDVMRESDIPRETQWEMFESIWIKSDYLLKSLPRYFILGCFKLNPFKDEIKNHSDIKPLISEDERITIYRGEASKSSTLKKSFSWTTDKEKAEFFATRFSSEKQTIYTATVHIDNVLAYFEGRGEKEVIVDFKNVLVTNVNNLV